MTDLQRIIDELGGKPIGQGAWMCHCPAHNDENPSLKVTSKDGKTLVYCHAGCTQQAVLDALRARGLWPEKAAKRTKSSIVATYDYQDEKGNLLFQVCRMEPKDFRQRRPDDKGSWIWNLKGVRRVLYRLPEILKTDRVFIPEGEKDVDTLISQGLAATCNPGGAGNWLPGYSESLKGKDCVLLPDSDLPGRQHAQKVAESLRGKAKSVKVIELPGLPEKGDVSDWLKAGHTKDELLDLALQAKSVNFVEEVAEPPDDLLNFEIKEKPHLDMTKFSGLTGAFVELATRNSEADPAAVSYTFLSRFGVEIGRNPYFNIGDTRHHGRLDVAIVGESSRSRKGTSAKPVSRLMSLKALMSPSKYKKAHFSPGPFSSGEGIIYAVRDPIQGWDKKHGKYEIIDPGVKDKRLFVLDEEFAGVLANTHREGNTLSMVIRSAWDNGRFDPLTKNSKISATDAHVGWVSHITQYELLSKLPECEGFNGFANRILWVYSQRQKIVPLPEPMPSKELAELQYLLLSVLKKCHKGEREITLTEQAKEAWIDEYYQKLTSQDEGGLLGVVTNRAEAQVRRLALLFTLLDDEVETSLKCLDQAMAAWQYCKDSARYIFKGQAQDSIARKISQALQDRGQLTGTEIRDLFSRHVKKDRIEKAIQELIASNTVEMISESTKGRPLNILKIKHTSDKSDKSDKRSDFEVLEDLGGGCSDTDENLEEVLTFY